MTSLPERLRSLALNVGKASSKDLLNEAADELDRRAVEIQRLGYKLCRVGRILDPHYEIQIPDRDPDEEGSGEVGSDEPYGEYDPPGLLVAIHPDGLVTVARDI